MGMGMNKVDCSSMVMYFADSSKLEKMSFKKKVDAKFIPPHEIEEPETRLKGFRLRFDEKPEKAIFLTRNKILAISEDENNPLKKPPKIDMKKKKKKKKKKS